MLPKNNDVNIRDKNSEKLNGYICSRGHSFYLEWTWPSPPLNCPCCGDQTIDGIWSGTIKRDF